MPAPVAPPKVIRQRRMRPGLLGLAVLLIALGGLGAAFAITSVKATGSYLAVARPVPQGTTLTADDLVTVQVAGGAGLAPVPASQQAQVVGKRAAVTLMPAPCSPWPQLTDKPLLTAGQQQVALGLRADQVPARRLLPGDKVILVGTPAKDAPPAITRYDAHRHRHGPRPRQRDGLPGARRPPTSPRSCCSPHDDRIAVVLDRGA